jgi:rod shape-determining protein MreC
VHDARTGRLVLGVLLLAAFGLITLDARGTAQLGRLRHAAAAVFGPVERAAAGVARPVAGLVAAIAGAPAAARQVQVLESQNQRLRAELNAAQLRRADAVQLDRLLQLAGRGGYRIVAARVIGIGDGYEQTVAIDAGTRDGVLADQTVLNADGLVGRVVQAGPVTSTVLLAADPAAAAGCRVEGSQQIGVVRGTGRKLSGGGTLRLELLGTTAVPVPGQRVVTLGSVGGHPYVPGVPVGVITGLATVPGSLTRTALVRPFVEFSALDVVGVVVVTPRHDPRDSVLPPAPPAPPPPSPPAGVRIRHGRGQAVGSPQRAPVHPFAAAGG